MMVLTESEFVFLLMRWYATEYQMKVKAEYLTSYYQDYLSGRDFEWLYYYIDKV